MSSFVTDGHPVHNPMSKSHIVVDPILLVSNQLYDFEPEVNVPVVPDAILVTSIPSKTFSYLWLGESIDEEWMLKLVMPTPFEKIIFPYSVSLLITTL